jgi:phosphoenolpyruvate synthase/pyruvate phosphate dikinase
MYDSFLNVSGQDSLAEKLLRVWASLFTSHAVAYRQRIGLPLAGVEMAVLVQEQLAAAAGVLFTRDPVSGSRRRMVVNSALGLGRGGRRWRGVVRCVRPRHGVPGHPRMLRGAQAHDGGRAAMAG